jgi:hypothetical protein
MDKNEIKDFPKLSSATSFIRKTIGEIAVAVIEKYSPLYKS